MSVTLTSNRRRPVAAPTFRLVLTIRDTDYALRRVSCDPSVGRAAYRLLKGDGTLYDVVQTPFGPACDCPDFVFRRDGLDPDGCKHVRALVAYGLIEK